MKIILAALSTLFLIACGDQYRFEKKDQNPISVQIRVIPEDQFGEEPTHFAYSRYTTVTLGGALEFWVLPILGDSLITQAEAETEGYINTPLWEIEGGLISDYAVRYRFEKAGIDTVRFFAIDPLGDTLRDSVFIYVDTPLKLNVHSPEKVVLDFDPNQPQGIQFEWSLQGVDSWENPWVVLYLTKDSSTLLNEYFAVSSTGSLRVPTEDLCPPDTNCRFWWRVVAVTSTYERGAPIRADSSQIFILQTRRTDTELSKAFIPLVATDFSLNTSITAQAERLGENTRFTWDIDTAKSMIESPLIPAGTWVLRVWDNAHPEYQADSTILQIGPGVLFNVAQPIILRDLVAPQISPILGESETLSTTNDTLWFLISDYGSGPDTSATTVKWPGTKYLKQGNKIGIPWTSLTSQDRAVGIQIIATDIAGNTSGQCTWKFQTLSNASVKVLTPTCQTPAPVQEEE